jgi:GNAT superfamily N-acetyltransferase
VSEAWTIEKLRREHALDSLDCGKEDLNRFLKRPAWNSQQAHSTQTYVLARDVTVRGYFSLAAGSISCDEATERVRKGLARHPIPVILLARLAVDKSLQARGIGPALLKDALLRLADAADTIGTRALLVQAKDDAAKGFYEHFNFEPSPSDPYHLLLIMKDLKRIVGI